MIRRVANHTLSEAGSVIRRLGKIHIPDRARVILAGSGRRIINDVHRACMCGDPGEYRSGCGRNIDHYSRRPVHPLIARHREENVMSLGKSCI